MTQYSEDRPVEIGELGSWELLGGFTHAPEFEEHVQETAPEKRRKRKRSESPKRTGLQRIDRSSVSSRKRTTAHVLCPVLVPSVPFGT